MIKQTIACIFLISNVSFSQAKPGAKPAAGSSSLDTSKKLKYKDKTDVNFDTANIDGAVKNPFGSMLSDRDQNFNRGFIKLRYNWHDQMISSVSGLSQ